MIYVDDEKIIARLDALIAEKASLEAEAETEAAAPAVRGVRSMPVVAPVEEANMMPEVFGLLKNMFAKEASATAEDPLEGKSINMSRLAKQSVVDEGDE